MAHLQGMDSSTKRGRVLKLAQAEGERDEPQHHNNQKDEKRKTL